LTTTNDASIENCCFYNIPTENVFICGAVFKDCSGLDLNGSVVHFSCNDFEHPTEVLYNRFTNTNEVGTWNEPPYCVNEVMVPDMNLLGYPIVMGSDTVSAIVAPEDLPIEVFPNPAMDLLYFKPRLSSVFTYQIINTLGSVLQQGETSDSGITIQYLPAGIYFLHLFSAQNQLVKLFVKG
jgi:hypothetical protein